MRAKREWLAKLRLIAPVRYLRSQLLMARLHAFRIYLCRGDSPGRFNCLAGNSVSLTGLAAGPLQALRALRSRLGVHICPAPRPTRKFAIPKGFKALSWASPDRVERITL